jgi:hypothetical protein
MEEGEVELEGIIEGRMKRRTWWFGRVEQSKGDLEVSRGEEERKRDEGERRTKESTSIKKNSNVRHSSSVSSRSRRCNVMYVH